MRTEATSRRFPWPTIDIRKPIHTSENVHNLDILINNDQLTIPMVEGIFNRRVKAGQDLVDFLISLIKDRTLDNSDTHDDRYYDDASYRSMIYRILRLSKYSEDPRLLELHCEKVLDSNENRFIRWDAYAGIGLRLNQLYSKNAEYDYPGKHVPLSDNEKIRLRDVFTTLLSRPKEEKYLKDFAGQFGAILPE